VFLAKNIFILAKISYKKSRENKVFMTIITFSAFLTGAAVTYLYFIIKERVIEQALLREIDHLKLHVADGVTETALVSLGDLIGKIKTKGLGYFFLNLKF